MIGEHRRWAGCPVITVRTRPYEARHLPVSIEDNDMLEHLYGLRELIVVEWQYQGKTASQLKFSGAVSASIAYRK
jgi:hypothetical protein